MIQNRATAVVTETLLYEANKALANKHAMTYYRYRNLCSLANLICFHDSALLLRGYDNDPNYRVGYSKILQNIRASGLEISDFQLGNHGDSITENEKLLFKEIIRSIYHGRELGIEWSELLFKKKKERYSEDFIEYLEDTVNSLYPDYKSIARKIYEYSQHNAGAPELLYFLRSHLISALARERQLTVIDSGARQIATMLEMNLYGSLPHGSQAQRIYEEIDTLLRHRLSNLPARPHPYLPLVLCCSLARAKDRPDIKRRLFEIRKELSEFRTFFHTAEQTIMNEDLSITTRVSKQEELHKMLQNVWLPVIKRLSPESNFQARAINFLKKLFISSNQHIGSFQVADTFGDNKGAELSYSSTSILNLAIETCKVTLNERATQKLISPNRALLEITDECLTADGIGTKIRSILPVQDFGYAINQKLESESFQGHEIGGNQ